MRKLFFILPIFIISILLYLPYQVEAATYSCGSASGQLDFCASGSRAVSANFCSNSEQLYTFGATGDLLHSCCPSGTYPIHGWTTGLTPLVYCCRYDENALGSKVAGAIGYRPLCCPDGWTGNDATLSPINGRATCSYKNDECNSKDSCDEKATGEGQTTPLVVVLGDLRYTAQHCRGSQCLYTRFAQENLCFDEYSVLINESPKQRCIGGSWEDVVDTCGDNKCEEGVEDDPGNSQYCPVDCSGVPSDPTTNASPPPEISCKDLCSGEGTFVDSDNDPDTDPIFVPGDQYANCCMCVCGTSDCPDDLKASRDVFTSDVWTELGCISGSKQGVIISIMRIFVGAVLGIGLLRFIQAAFMLNTDDPEKIKEGKSIFISAIMAIVMGVMMPILINFLGLDILGIGELFSFK